VRRAMEPDASVTFAPHWGQGRGLNDAMAHALRVARLHEGHVRIAPIARV